MSVGNTSDTQVLTSPSVDFTSTGVKWKVPLTQPVRVKRWGVLLSAAPGDTGTLQLRKVSSTGTATVLSTIELLTTHTADDLVYAELTGSSDLGIGSPGATPVVTADFHLDVNASASAASVSAEYVIVEFSLEPAEPNSNTLMTETT